MFRERYYFDRNTLRFEKVKKPLKRKLRDGLIYFTILSLIAIGFRIVYDEHFTSTKLKRMAEKNEMLKAGYSLLNNEILQAEKLLTGIQIRDDKVYRSVFNMDPIPGSVREAGFGGSESYYHLLFSRNAPIVTNTAKKLEKLLTKARIQSLSLNDLVVLARKQQQFLSCRPSIQPISPQDNFWLTSTFGMRFDPFTKRKKYHHGLDLAGDVGLKIYATGDGKIVTTHHSNSGYGNEVVIDHGFGYVTRYAHLSKILVKKGEVVTRGQQIGKLGSTGRSTGPHLHYEVLFNSKPVNPMYYYYEDLSGDEFQKMVALNEN
jgi:murein DD-endopeptidase MepM/ murein hydrolase activator NlpD